MLKRNSLLSLISNSPLTTKERSHTSDTDYILDEVDELVISSQENGNYYYCISCHEKRATHLLPDIYKHIQSLDNRNYKYICDHCKFFTTNLLKYYTIDLEVEKIQLPENHQLVPNILQNLYNQSNTIQEKYISKNIICKK